MKARSGAKPAKAKHASLQRGVATLRGRLETIEEASGYRLVALLGVDVNTLRRWRAGELRPSGSARALVALLALLHRGGVDLSGLADGRVDAVRGGPLDPEVEAWEAEGAEDEDDPPAIIPEPAPKRAHAHDLPPLPPPVESRAPLPVVQFDASVPPASSLLVQIRHRDGRVESCSPERAARLGDVVEPEGEWTEAQAAAVLAAHEARQARAAELLIRDGLLPGHGPGPAPRPTFDSEGSMGRLAGRGDGWN